MSRRRPYDSWPPLIVAADTPRLIRWRDFGLTLLMWLLFAIMLETEFELFFGRYLEHLGWGDFDTNPHWERFFQRLRPFITIIVVLLTILFVAALATIQRRRRSLLLDPPPALAAEEEARRGRIDVAALLAARELANVVVHVTDNREHRIEPRHSSEPTGAQR